MRNCQRLLCRMRTPLRAKPLIALPSGRWGHELDPEVAMQFQVQRRRLPRLHGGASCFEPRGGVVRRPLQPGRGKASNHETRGNS